MEDFFSALAKSKLHFLYRLVYAEALNFEVGC